MKTLFWKNLKNITEWRQSWSQGQKPTRQRGKRTGPATTPASIPFVCVTGRGVGSDSCQPRVSAVLLSWSQQPCSAPLDSCLWLLSWTQSMPTGKTFGLPLFLLPPLFFHHYCLVQRTRPSQDMPERSQLQLCHFCL